MEFLGFKIQKGQVVLQKHVLNVFTQFLDQILDKTQLQRFLGSLNYIRPFYKGQAADIHLLQQRLKKNPAKWSTEMTLAVQKIKAKVLDLPPLSLPQGLGQLIIDTDASSHTWGGVLIEVINGKEQVCGYGSGSFKAAEINYPSNPKEILAVKKTVMHFKLFLKPVKFIIRTDLKIMPDIFKNDNLMAGNSSKILKWFSLLSSFDYEIIYKPG